MEQIHFKYSCNSVGLEIKTFEHNKNLFSSGATFSDGDEYCGFPCENNNNTFKTMIEAINYQIKFFEKMFSRIIDESDNKARVSRTHKMLLELLKFKNNINDSN